MVEENMPKNDLDWVPPPLVPDTDEPQVGLAHSGLAHAMLPFDEMTERLQRRREFISNQLKEGIDYGRVPGVSKPFMWKSGAEKLLELHGLLPILTRVDSMEDRNLATPYFEFTYRCDLLHVGTKTEIRLGAEGTCNNREKQYYNAERGEARGDPWVQRNTCIKMSQKRAVVAAALMVTSLSCDFTQDEEAVDQAPPPRPAVRGPQMQKDTLAPGEEDPPWMQDGPPKMAPQPPRGRPPVKVVPNAGGGRRCTEKQGRFIYRLVMQKGEMEFPDFMAMLREQYGDHVRRTEDLSMDEAKEVIDALQGKD